ncbi:MAG: ribbon-helix-helix domain-containing protein [Deferribacteraceae bacterium]|jgi:metal-responsive CopG/Arc/MetJ family transcriptional regulator|nr:ribbon-helix-helix domain-containing protein [Deferribacteraceae bacterium]
MPISKNFTLRIDTDLLSVVREEAKQENLTSTELIRKAIANYLVQKNKGKSKESELSLILSAINESNVELKNFITEHENMEHVQKTFSYNMLLKFVQRICAGIVIASDKNDAEKLKKIYKDPNIWELLK